MAKATQEPPAQEPPAPVRVYLSFADKDRELARELQTHLGGLQLAKRIRMWSPDQAAPGPDFKETVRAELEAAEVILVLVSAQIFGSERMIDVDLPDAKKHRAAKTARVIPIWLGPATGFAEALPWLGGATGLPRDGSIAAHPPAKRDEIWAEIARELGSICATVQKERPPDSPAAPPPPVRVQPPVAPRMAPPVPPPMAPPVHPPPPRKSQPPGVNPPVPPPSSPRPKIQVDGDMHRELMDALMDAFPRRIRLAMMLRHRLKKNLDAIAGEGNLEETVFSLLEAANSGGWTHELVAAARESNPGNPKLVAFAEGYGGAVQLAMPGALSLERLIRDTRSYIDVAGWRRQLGLIEAQVCRVEVGDGQMGTGFLIGPDLCITNHHVLADVVEGGVDPRNVVFRFDYKALKDGTPISLGTKFRLAEEWLVDESPPAPHEVNPMLAGGVVEPDQLDYVVVRLAGSPGSSPIGKEAERGAPLRGWMAGVQWAFKPDTPLFIVQHPKGWPLKLTLETDAIIALNENGTRVRYRTNTERGSSGSPCFNEHLQLVALHHSGDPNFDKDHKPEYNDGIPFTRIVERLARPELGLILPAPPPPPSEEG